MSQRTLRCLVVGFGKIGEQHVRAYRRLSSCVVAGVVEPAAARAQAAATSYGLATWPSLEQALAETEVDVVSVCTPDFAHAAPLEQAARAGAHVFLEKPLGMTLAEAEAALETCQRTGVQLGLGFKMRFEWVFSRARWLIERDAIGVPQMGYFSRPQRAGRQTRYEAPLVLEFADLCHEIDLATWLLQAEPISVFEAAPGPAPASRMLLSMVHEHGRLSSLYHGVSPEFPSTAGLYDAKFHIVGTKGHLLGERPDRLWLCSDTPPIEERLARVDPPEYAQAPFDAEIAAFVGAVLDGREPPVTGRDGLRAARVADAALRSLQEGRPITLDAGAPLPLPA